MSLKFPCDIRSPSRQRFGSDLTTGINISKVSTEGFKRGKDMISLN